MASEEIEEATLEESPEQSQAYRVAGRLSARGQRRVPSAARRSVTVRRCAAGTAIEFLQEKWVLHIVHALLTGPMGFNELGRVIGGCNPTTLTHRLARLEELGVVDKASCGYSLTPAGQELERVIIAIRSWAVAHLPADK